MRWIVRWELRRTALVKIVLDEDRLVYGQSIVALTRAQHVQLIADDSEANELARTLQAFFNPIIMTI